MRRETQLHYAAWRRRTLSDLSGRVAVVTGATGGLGFETARGLLSLHARVILACRDAGKGEAVRARLLANFPDAALDLLTLDLSRRASIADFAARERRFGKTSEQVQQQGGA